MELTCIMCPVGCTLKITKTKKEIIVTGNSCPRGKEYGLKEVTSPERIVTSVKKYKQGTICLKTDKPIRKDLVDKCLIEIKNSKLKDKISVGETLIKNVLNTGVNIIVTSIN